MSCRCRSVDGGFSFCGTGFWSYAVGQCLSSSMAVMPRLVQLYLRSIGWGVCLGLIFTLLILWSDAGGLRHLVLRTPGGWLAIALLIVFHALMFSGVQFAIAVMSMADSGSSGSGHKRPLTGRSQLLHSAKTARKPARAPRPSKGIDGKPTHRKRHSAHGGSPRKLTILKNMWDRGHSAAALRQHLPALFIGSFIRARLVLPRRHIL